MYLAYSISGKCREIRFQALLIRFFLFSALSLGTGSSIADHQKEYEVKAAFIITLNKFIQWPLKNELTQKTDKLNFCIVEDQKKKHSHHVLDDGKLQQHFNYISTEKLSQCNIVFISKVSDITLIETLKKIKLIDPIITISDTPGYANHGVMINFYEEEGKIGFEINWNEMTARGFEISSRVLKLARLVNGT